MSRFLLGLMVALMGCKEVAPQAPSADSTTVPQATPDTTASNLGESRPDGARQLGQGCCGEGASQCTLGSCDDGLACFVVTNGPYTDRGICTKPCADAASDCACPSGTSQDQCPRGAPTCAQGQCMWVCEPDTSVGDSSVLGACATDLLCLPVSGKSICLPRGD